MLPKRTASIYLYAPAGISFTSANSVFGSALENVAGLCYVSTPVSVVARLVTFSSSMPDVEGASAVNAVRH